MSFLCNYVLGKVISMGFSNLGNVDVTTFMVPHEKQPLLARPFPFSYTT